MEEPNNEKKHSYSEVMAGLPLAMSIPRILVYHSMNVIYYLTIHAIVTMNIALFKVFVLWL